MLTLCPSLSNLGNEGIRIIRQDAFHGAIDAKHLAEPDHTNQDDEHPNTQHWSYQNENGTEEWQVIG